MIVIFLSQVEVLSPSMNKVTIGEHTVRYILKIYYDSFQYKTIVASDTTTAIAVCALVASKFDLEAFSFRLFAIVNDKGKISIPPTA
jgi:hypothetical protein